MISVLWGRHLKSRRVVRCVIPRCGDSFVCLFVCLFVSAPGIQDGGVRLHKHYQLCSPHIRLVRKD